MKASARKIYGRYKAVILHPAFGAHIGKTRSEYIGTRWHPTEDGRDMRVTAGAPLYDTRDEALRVAKAVIDRREARLRARTGYCHAGVDCEQCECVSTCPQWEWDRQPTELLA